MTEQPERHETPPATDSLLYWTSLSPSERDQALDAYVASVLAELRGETSGD